MKPVICLLGPTASGKTALAIELSKLFPIQLISVDSALVYRGLDIGTSKPTKAEQQIAPHWLIDICAPDTYFSAATFVEEAYNCIEKAHQAGKIPLLVGGTMLYFKALLQGLSPLPESDVELRQKLQSAYEAKGLPAMHQWLRDLDPESAERIHVNDPQRILRALEVNLLSGKTMSAHFISEKPTFPYPVLSIALHPDRTLLHARIEERFLLMLEKGFLEEVRAFLQESWFDPTLPSMRTVGYRQAISYWMGRLQKDECIQQSIYATRQLAKRQITWIRNWPLPLHVISTNSVLPVNEVRLAIRDFLR